MQFLRYFLFLQIYLIASVLLAVTPCEDEVAKSLIVHHDAAVHELIEKYRNALGPYHDPFAVVFSPEQGEKLFAALETRTVKGQPVKNPLAVINALRKTSSIEDRKYAADQIAWIVDDATAMIEGSQATMQDLQSNLLALQFSGLYLDQYKTPEMLKIVEKKTDPELPLKKPKKKEKKPQQESPPEYLDMPKNYKPPTTEDDNDSGGDKQKKFRICDTNSRTSYFGQRYYSAIDRNAEFTFREEELPGRLPRIDAYKDTEVYLLVRTLGQNNVELFLPPGMKPLQPSDPRLIVSKSKTGSFLLEKKVDIEEVKIPLVRDENIQILSHILDFYKRPVGFDSAEWPDEVQAAIFHKYSKDVARKDPLRVAQAVSDHLSVDYKYSKSRKSQLLDSLACGHFPCDIAALAGAAILRDGFQIPTRVVSGFRAKKFIGDGEIKSYLVVPQESHVWLEVFHDGRWHVFDPTPLKKLNPQDEENEADAYQDIPIDNLPKVEPDDKSISQGDEQQADKKDHKKTADTDTKKRLEETGLDNKDKKDSKKPLETAKKDSEGKDAELEKLLDSLTLGSIELNPTGPNNALLDRMMRVILKDFLAPDQRGGEIMNKLASIKKILRAYSNVEIKDLVLQAQSAHKRDHPMLKNWLNDLRFGYKDKSVNSLYEELHQIQLGVHTFARTLDSSGVVPVPHELMRTMAQAMEFLQKYAHKDSLDMGLVQELSKGLPPVAQRILKDDYNFDVVGPNQPTKNIAKDLKENKLRDLRLMSTVSSLTDFVLNPEPSPEFMEIKTWTRDYSKPRGRDILSLQRISDWPRAILGQPGKTLEENMLEQSAYLAVHRKRVDIAAAHGKEESERVTVVLYDTSGSMSGNPGEFQAGIIAAFTAAALSDVSPSGKYRHKIVIIPFDSEPGLPIVVNNATEALEVIKNYRKKLANTSGGTDIQKAYLAALAVIAEAGQRNGEPLAAANIVLMTDGQASIDANELMKARDAIDRRTPLQTMFIALNQTSDELIRFAQDSKSIGSDRGFYREFTGELINEIIKEAQTIDLKDRKDFYSEKHGKDLPREFENLLHEAFRLANNLTAQIERGRNYTPAARHLQDIKTAKWLDLKQVDRPLDKWLIRVRQFIKNPIFQDKKLLERVIDDLMAQVQRISGLSFDSMSNHEQMQLRHLLIETAGIKTEPE